MTMATPASAKASAFDQSTDDEDDMPLVFKRSNNSTSKSNQANKEVKRPLSLSQNANGQSSNVPKGKSSVPSTKSPPVKSPIGSPKASTSFVKSTSLKSPVANSKASSSVGEQLKQSSKQNASTVVKEEMNSVKRESKPITDDEDSDDGLPLSARLSRIPNNANKGGSSTSHVKDEDSDDDKAPLSSKLSIKLNVGTSSNKPNNSNERKPLASKLQQNGFTSKDKQQKTPLVPPKRPMDKNNSSDQASKKPKLSDVSTSGQFKQVTIKAEQKAVDEDNIPLAQRKQKSASDNKVSSAKQKSKVPVSSSSKKINKNNKKQMKNTKYVKSTKFQPSSSDGQKKWTTLVHNGVIFPPPYKPHGVKILYKGKPVDLTPQQEEVATMFAVMKETEYMQKPKFRDNFWNDWRKLLGKNHVIQNLEGCNFDPIYEWHAQEKEKKKQMTTEEKKEVKEEKLKQEEKYMWAIVDGVKEKVGNFRVEPPGLFRGRGEHPKMGKLKKRIRPGDITINIGKDAPIPECPIPGESWKEVKHDNTVTWLAFWNDPINPKEFKYVFLAASSSLKGQSDKEKYEKARKLEDYIDNIRAAYQKDFKNKDLTKKQIAVATYLIDVLALRAGNEKDDDEADTVGCCTLKVANVECIPGSFNLKFDFLGKDSIRYENTVEVKPEVYDAIGTFQKGKKQTDDLFDMLDTSKLNAHLKGLMPGLTAKVFRTYNASTTLDKELYKETKDGDVAEKVAIYQRANKQVAIICNHQRTISKTHGAQMERLNEKIAALEATVKELKSDLDRAKKGKPPGKDADGKQKRNLSPEAIQKKISSTEQRIAKMELDKSTKEDLKTVALGTSKINYLDPRITVAWCKRHDVPIEKIFNKSLLAKFAWAMDVDPQFRF
ncbi:DNA topoisomerase 1 beta-like [Euphorbia lathyris]|uniref:DNA topoisomerase 1 beta-like n=1 Tax=Euphorbia lathyris TaxID=212925 RepID=UPI003314481D